MPSNSIVNQTTKNGSNYNSSGSGNLKVTNTYTITSLSSKDLVSFTKEFLSYLNSWKWSSAEDSLSAILKIPSIDSSCAEFLKILQYKLSVSQGGSFCVSKDLFVNLLRSTDLDPIIRDVIESIYLSFFYSQSEGKARKFFESLKEIGSYTEAKFYEKVASTDELVKLMNSGKCEANEHELCSYVGCALRNGQYLMAVEVATELRENYQNENSEILYCLAKAYQIYTEFDANHYWLISSDQNKRLEEDIRYCLDLIEKTDDERVVRCSFILLSTTSFHNSNLFEFCSTKVEVVKKLFPDFDTKIFLNGSMKSGSVSGILSQENKSISSDEFAQISYEFDQGEINPRKIEKWLSKGGEVATEDSRAKELMEIYLLSLACNGPSSQKKIIDLSIALDDFLKTSTAYFQELNIQAVHRLCVNLNYAGLPLHVVKILEPHIADYPWASPILDVYAEALFEADQHGKLDFLLKRMDKVDDSFRIHYVKISIACQRKYYPEAIELCNSALRKYSSNCYSWLILLKVLHQSELPLIEIQSKVSDIPFELFERFSENGLELVQLIAISNLSLAESIMLEWFIDDPLGMAIYVSDLHHSSIVSDTHNGGLSRSSPRCLQAIVYTLDGRQHTKMLVDDCNPSEYLLNPDSSLGQLLQGTSVGEDLQHGLSIVKVVKKLAPYTGAYQLSLKIREEINTGDDFFHRFDVDIENGIDDVRKIFERIDTVSGPELMQASIDGVQVPFAMKLEHTHKGNLVKGAFLYLHNNESNQTLGLLSMDSDCGDSVVLDVLSLAYLSLTGLGKGLKEGGIRTYISQETKDVVSNWLKEIKNPDYFAISNTNRGLIKSTAEDVAKDNSIMNLSNLLQLCEVLAPDTIDMPEVLSKSAGMLDVSHYSSLKVSLSKGVPFLCLDSQLWAYYQELGIPLVNANQLMTNLRQSGEASSYQLAACHVELGLQVPLLYQDIIDLCHQGEKEQYVAFRVLKKYPCDYPNPDVALWVLKYCCLNAITKAYFQFKGEVDFSLSKRKYVEHIVYACCESAMECLEGSSRGQRLALFIFEIESFLREGPDKVASNLINFSFDFFRRFASGHFIDGKLMDSLLNTLREENRWLG